MYISVEISKTAQIGKFFGEFTGHHTFTDSYDVLTEMFTTIWNEFKNHTDNIKQVNFKEKYTDEADLARMFIEYQDGKQVISSVIFTGMNMKDLYTYPLTKKGATDCMKQIVKFMRTR